MLTHSRSPETASSEDPENIGRARSAIRRHVHSLCLVLILIAAHDLAVAAPLALLDRNGSHVSLEAYAPNIVRVTLSIDKDLALAPAGFGFIAAADATGWKHRTT